MDKNEIQQKIESLPKFELRRVSIGAPLNDESYEYEWQFTKHHRAVCVTGTQEPVAMVSPDYCLVQFSDSFIPILEPLDVKDGNVKYHDGYSIMTLYPDGEEFMIGESTEVGIACHNSVNKKSGLSIKFIVKDKSRTFTLPKKMASFKRIHVGKVQQSLKDYAQVAMKIRLEWSTIVSKFTTTYIRDDEIDGFCKTLGLGEYLSKKIKMMNFSHNSMWDLMMEAFDLLSTQKYKSEIHRQQRLDDYCEAIFTYSFVAKLA